MSSQSHFSLLTLLLEFLTISSSFYRCSERALSSERSGIESRDGKSSICFIIRKNVSRSSSSSKIEIQCKYALQCRAVHFKLIAVNAIFMFIYFWIFAAYFSNV